MKYISPRQFQYLLRRAKVELRGAPISMRSLGDPLVSVLQIENRHHPAHGSFVFMYPF
jgi:hypothetical protein